MKEFLSIALPEALGFLLGLKAGAIVPSEALKRYIVVCDSPLFGRVRAAAVAMVLC